MRPGRYAILAGVHRLSLQPPFLMQKISVLGLGAMGARMAARLLDAGYDVTVYNRTPERAAPLRERGARVASSPRDAADGADLVLACVRDDEASRAVWLGEAGALAGLSTDAIAVESSTLTTTWMQDLAESVRDHGADFLDAPVVGSRPHVEAGKLTYLVGGDADALTRARPVLEVLGGAVHHVGPAGTGTAMKLAVNAMFAVQAATLAELLATLRGLGIESDEAAQILNALPTASPAAARVATLMAERSYAPNFPIELVAKDLGYALAAGESAGIDSTVVAAAHRAFADAVEHGFGSDDIVGIAQRYG